MTDQTSSFVLLQNALKQRGFSTRIYKVGDDTYAEYTHPNGKIWLTRTKHFSYPLNHGAVMEMADKKSLANAWVEQFDVKTPATCVVMDDDSLEAAKEFLAHYKTVVVKPESSFGSHGLTLNVTTSDELKRAISKARRVRQHSEAILVQKQIEGKEYRFAVLNEKVVSVLLRQPAEIVGDGSATIAQLIEKENAERQVISKSSMVQYPKIQSIATIEYDETCIPAQGEVVPLSTSSMIYGGASAYEVSDDVDVSYVRAAEKLAHKFGAEFIVVDLMILDIAQPMTHDNTYFLEFNKAPALKMFYATRNNKNFDIVPLLADAITAKMETL